MRFVRMVGLRSHLVSKSQMNFRELLERRSYSGTLHFDHTLQELQITVRAADKKKARATLQLSGGERSFSTVSFLSAMWDSINNPFRALDEFDVFMVKRASDAGRSEAEAAGDTDVFFARHADRLLQDAVNRKTATKVIIENSNANTSRQFIIITPLELTYGVGERWGLRWAGDWGGYWGLGWALGIGVGKGSGWALGIGVGKGSGWARELTMSG